MKCIHCSSDTKGPVRRANGGRCGSCLHAFAFEPTLDAYQMTDPAFAKLIDNVSGKGALFFTERQLWYEMNRFLHARARPGCGKAAAVAMTAGTGGAWALAHLPRPLLVGALALGAGLALSTVAPLTSRRKGGARYEKLDFVTFQTKYLERWTRIHGVPEKLIQRLDARLNNGAAGGSLSSAPDLTAYSFDRALIVDHGEIAAMLVANRFHFENNCAILSLDRRFPVGGLFGTVKTMLQRNPNLTIAVMHDAAPAGIEATRRLREEGWFPEAGVRIADLGLTPRQAIQADLILTREAPSASTSAFLPPEEIAWLAEGNRAELAALRPARLMTIAYQGFTRIAQAGDGVWDSGGVWIFGYDPYPGGGWVYAADSPPLWDGPVGPAGDAGAPDSFG